MIGVCYWKVRLSNGQGVKLDHRHKKIHRLLSGLAGLPCFVFVGMSPATG
jgi:hypothetical protein